MTNFFELVNDKFFYPLANRNKQLNVDLLFCINNKMQEEMRLVPRDEIISWIVEYLEYCPTCIYDDETDVEDNRDVRIIASNKLLYFVNCGWLIVENDSKTLKNTYQIDNNAIIILDAIEEIIRNDSKPMEYTGYVYNVYSALMNFNMDHAVDSVEQIYKSTRDLIDRLRGLTATIKKFSTNLLERNDMTPDNILHQLLVEYQEKVIVKNFENLRVKDNPVKYKNRIIELIDYYLSPLQREKLITDYIKKKKKSDFSEQNKKEATEFFNDRLEYVKRQFEFIEEKLEYLNAKNTKYTAAVRSRLSFILNEDVDIEGRLDNILKGISKTQEFIDDNTLVNLYDYGAIDENSLYIQPRKHRRISSIVQINDENIINDDILREAKSRMFSDNSFNCFNVNQFVVKQLGNKTKMEVKDFIMNSFDDLVKTFLAYLYSGNKEMSYVVHYRESSKNNFIIRFNRKILNFEVEIK